MKFETIETFEKRGKNLWARNGSYYRLHGHAITPNGCWIASPYMRELKDIDLASGEDVWGNHTIQFEACGTVPSYNEFIES